VTHSGYPSAQSFGRPAFWLPARLATIQIEDACALERVGCSRGGSFSRLLTDIPCSFNPLPYNPLQCAFTSLYITKVLTFCRTRVWAETDLCVDCSRGKRTFFERANPVRVGRLRGVLPSDRSTSDRSLGRSGRT
jgi:hypothetical protein